MVSAFSTNSPVHKEIRAQDELSPQQELEVLVKDTRRSRCILPLGLELKLLHYNSLLFIPISLHHTALTHKMQSLKQSSIRVHLKCMHTSLLSNDPN